MDYKGRDIQIHFEPFPAQLQGIISGIVVDCGGQWSVSIDNTRNRQRQRMALGHELAHIFLGHLDNTTRTTVEQEAAARASAWHYYREAKQAGYKIPNQTNIE